MKKFVLILFLGVFCPLFSFGQNEKIDSLKQLVRLAPNDSLKIFALKNVAWEYLTTRSNIEQARIYIDSVHDLAQAMGSENALSIANYQYAVLERQQDNYSTALDYIEQYLVFTRTKGDSMALANGLYQKAYILNEKGDLEKSTEIYYHILEIYEQLNEPYSIADVLGSLGEQYKNQEKYDQALEHYIRALDIFKSLGAKDGMANNYFNIGDLYHKKEDFGQALDYYKKALALDQEMESLWGMGYDYDAIGSLYSDQQNFDDALQMHLKALDIRKQLPQKRELAESHLRVSTDYRELKNYKNAEFHLLQAIAIAEEIGANTSLQKSYESMSTLLTETEDFEKALFYKNKSAVLKDSLFNVAKSQQIQELQVKYDTEKKQDAIAVLQKDAEIKDLRLQRQRALRNIIIAIALVILSSAVLFFYRYRAKQREKREAEEKERQIVEERKRTQIEKQRVEELQRIDELKDQFLANTSHELRTPLVGIIGLTESLKDGIAGKLPKAAIDNLNMISNSGKRLSHLVNDILDFSKLKNRDLKLNLRPVDLFSISNIIIRLSEPLIKDKKIKLVNHLPEEGPLVEADENRLQQIMHNLIGNAIKFTHKGEITLCAKEEDEFIYISISDTGIGIPTEKLDSIFNSFEQADGSLQREYGGTGLGLAVTKQLVELHGGTITVISEVTKGSTFTFSLKKSATSKKDIERDSESNEVVQQLKETTNTPIRLKKHSSHKKLKILVVDDEPVNRRVLENHLKVAGYHVVEANNGKEALKLLEGELSYNLVLLDIMMPEMSGYEVCEIIRKRYLPSELPVVLLTAKNRVSELVNGFNAGANDYLTKPFSKNELLSRIKTHINLNTIHRATNKFVPSEFIKSIGRDSITEVELGDHTEKNIAVLFSDIREYTTIAEGMTPEQNFKFVNSYMGKMGPIIHKNQGFINQYLGDGIMALFPRNAEDALNSAIAMQRIIRIYNRDRVNENKIPISIGIGIHTGPLVMGIIGDTKRNDTAIISDTVNAASRVEGITKHYGANIIISNESLQTITKKEDFNLRYMGKVKVKGKDKIIEIFECFDGDNEDNIELKKATFPEFKVGMQYFEELKFSKASAKFDDVLEINPNDLVSEYFSKKSKYYAIDGVPKDWGVVNVMLEK